MEKVKLLFLPHCLNKEQAQLIKMEGKKKGYEVFVTPGGSMVKKILLQFEKIDEIVGVACGDELKIALEYTSDLAKKNTIVKPIHLLKDGCKDTEVSLTEVLQALQ